MMKVMTDRQMVNLYMFSGSDCSVHSVFHHAWVQRARDRGFRPLTNYKATGFLSNSGQDPLKNHYTTKPAFDVGPSSAHQRNAI